MTDILPFDLIVDEFVTFGVRDDGRFPDGTYFEIVLAGPENGSQDDDDDGLTAEEIAELEEALQPDGSFKFDDREPITLSQLFSEVDHG